MRRKVPNAAVKSLAKKFLQLIISLAILIAAVFFLSRLAPGEPLKAYYGDSLERMSVLEKAAAEKKLGLDKSVFEQFFVWGKNALNGDFGISFRYKQDVFKVIGNMYMNTLVLGGISFLLIFIFAAVLGVFCAEREDSLADKLICKAGTALNSIPTFWVALVLILIFCVNLKILPSAGAYSVGNDSFLGRLIHLILPITVLVLGHLWYFAYMVRNRMLEEMREEYVATALAKGLKKKRIVWRHCFVNFLPSLLSIMAISLPHIVGGTYIVEKVFSYPGLGTLAFESAQYHDYNMLMVLSLLTGAIVIVSSMLLEFVNVKIDPRMKKDAGREIYE